MLNSDRSLKPLIGLAVIALVFAAFAMACQGEEETPAEVTKPADTPAPMMAKEEKPADTPVPAMAKEEKSAEEAKPEMAMEDMRTKEGDMYGGTYTYGGIALHWNTEPTSWDVSESGGWQMFCYSHYYQSVMLTGDIETF